MMSLEVIIAVNNEIARQAAREGLVPYVPSSADEAVTPFFCPEHRVAEASGLAEDRGDVVRRQDWARAGLGSLP